MSDHKDIKGSGLVQRIVKNIHVKAKGKLVRTCLESADISV